MAGRPTPPVVSQSLRVEVLKELQSLIDSKEARERIDKGAIGEVKGREHWILQLLLRAHEFDQSHLDQLVGTAYSNMLARLQAIDDRLARSEQLESEITAELKERFAGVETGVADRINKGMGEASERLTQVMNDSLTKNLDTKWQPIGDSVETFHTGSRQMLKDVADTYRVATQTRLLLNENARRLSDLGRDIVALEESLKLVVAKTIEEGLAPLEERVGALVGRVSNGYGAVTAEASSKPSAGSGSA
ncbi:MAG: hypothetical protein L3K09_03350 [Thermoplasmata archaeon]|nr:hypothetical protein [Thermoplasmata archaeon]